MMHFSTTLLTFSYQTCIQKNVHVHIGEVGGMGEWIPVPWSYGLALLIVFFLPNYVQTEQLEKGKN